MASGFGVTGTTGRYGVPVHFVPERCWLQQILSSLVCLLQVLPVLDGLFRGLTEI